MSEEIKEILDNLKEWSVEGNLYFEINDEKAKKLYNYITNLQQENKQLKERIDKAIEWIFNIQLDKDKKHLEPYIATDELDELLEILGDKE